MRKLVLSVSVGCLFVACDGSGGPSPMDLDEGGAQSADASERDASAPATDDAESASELDGSAPGDAATTRDGGERDGGGRDAGGNVANDGGNAPKDAGGALDAARDGGDAASVSPEAGGGNTGRPIFVIAGYRSGIAFSTDLGASWRTVHGPTGPFADNEYVLSGCAFGKGTFVVAGFSLFSSSDGEHWTQRTSAGTEWLGSVNFGNGVFVGAGGTGFTQWSSDGASWRKGSPSLGEHSDTSAFGNGTFMATTRSGQWWRTTDGNMWTRDTTGHGEKIVWCGDRFADQEDCNMTVPTGQVAFGEGVWIRVENGTQVRRSTNGQSWTNAGKADFEANCVAFGYVP